MSNRINNLKNKVSYGHDEISNKLIKRAGPALIKSLTLMVNQMLLSCSESLPIVQLMLELEKTHGQSQLVKAKTCQTVICLFTIYNEKQL